LHQSGVKLVHLNNGLYHLGLESSQQYLKKIREAAANLHQLDSKKILPAAYADDISLLAALKKLRKWHITGLVATWFKFRRKSLEKRLCGPNPSMLLLDLYKLGAISHID
jgi:hypothetical protein